MITALSIGTGGLGRMGNQMFTIAGCIGIATKSGQPYAFPRWINHDNALFGDNADDMEQYFVNPLPRLTEESQPYGYFWGYKDICLPTGNWSIDAHMQDPRYFEHCMPLIRDAFRMRDEPEQNDYVAIHYRAGDYIDDPNAYHPRCSKEYYEKAVSLFPSNTKFLLFSDDMETAKYLIGSSFDYDTIIHQGGYIKDFKLMKRCKSFITANSSFSAMAAILGEHPDKKIIMPKRWFGSQAGITFDGYPKEAIVI
jgi:hypothetical protein